MTELIFEVHFQTMHLIETLRIWMHVITKRYRYYIIIHDTSQGLTLKLVLLPGTSENDLRTSEFQFLLAQGTSEKSKKILREISHFSAIKF